VRPAALSPLTVTQGPWVLPGRPHAGALVEDRTWSLQHGGGSKDTWCSRPALAVAITSSGFGRYCSRAGAPRACLQVTAALAIDSDLLPQQVLAPGGDHRRRARGLRPGMRPMTRSAYGEAVQEYLVVRQGAVRSIVRSPPPARRPLHPRSHLAFEIFESITSYILWTSRPAARLRRHRYGFYGTAARTHSGWACSSDHAARCAARRHLLGGFPGRTGPSARISTTCTTTLSPTAASGALEASPVVEVSLWLSLLRACYGVNRSDGKNQPFRGVRRSGGVRRLSSSGSRASPSCALPAAGGASGLIRSGRRTALCRRCAAGTAAGAGCGLKLPREGRLENEGSRPDVTKVVVESGRGMR